MKANNDTKDILMYRCDICGELDTLPNNTGFMMICQDCANKYASLVMKEEKKMKKKWKKEKRITSISELENVDFIIINDKTYHKGWWQNWSYRMLLIAIENGKCYHAEIIEEK